MKTLYASKLSFKGYCSIFYVFLSALALALLSIEVEVNTSLGIFIMAFLVVLLGLPHGALDFEVARSMDLVKSFKSALIFSLAYLSICASGIFFWVLIPWLGLSIFLIISVLHFSSDWRESLPFPIRFNIANIILCGPSLVYSEQVISIFNALLVEPAHSEILVQVLRYGLFVSALILLSAIALKGVKKKTSSINKTMFIEINCLLLCSVILPPLVHFVLYFCFLHSVKHLSDVASSLNYSKRKALLYSLPFVLLTLVLAYIASWYWGSSNITIDVLRWVFIGLFGLTLAHMCLIHIWHSRQVKRLF